MSTAQLNTQTQQLLEVKLRKFGREVLHAYQAGMGITAGRVSSESLDAYFKAFPIMDTVEFRDVPRATSSAAAPPESIYTPITIKDRILLVGWKALQNIYREDQNIEAHINFSGAYAESVRMAMARKKDQTVFAGLVAPATQINDSVTGGVEGAMTTTSVGLGNSRYIGFDSTDAGFDIYKAFLRIKEYFNTKSIGYNEEIYVTMTPRLENILRNHESFINRDLVDKRVIENGLSEETRWNDFTLVKTDPALLPNPTAAAANNVKMSYDKGYGTFSNTGAPSTAANGFSDVLVWTKRAVKAGTHSRGFRSIFYRETTRMNAPAIQHDFFCGSTRLLDDGVLYLRVK